MAEIIHFPQKRVPLYSSPRAAQEAAWSQVLADPRALHLRRLFAGNIEEGISSERVTSSIILNVREGLGGLVHILSDRGGTCIDTATHTPRIELPRARRGDPKIIIKNTLQNRDVFVIE